MATNSNTVLATASTLLQDTTNVRWPAEELLGYLNEGQREIALYKPNASLTLDSAFGLAAGTKQDLPSGGLVLIDVIRNTGDGGATPGRAIRVVAREVLDAQVPNWHTATGDYVKHYVYSPLDPKRFYVYPARNAGGRTVEILYGATPAVVTTGQVITIDDIWTPALVNYICYRAYSKDAEYAANAAAATGYYQAFIAQMTGKTTGEMVTNPNVSMGSFNPNVPGMK